MTPDVVVDIGNSRMKWGHVGPNGVGGLVNLSHDPAQWSDSTPSPNRSRQWAVASVNPPVTERFVEWVRGRGERVWVFDDWKQAGIPVAVEFPERVGADRLMNALAARRLVVPGTPAVIVDAGTAVTVDLLDAGGAFTGGAIFPGLLTMTAVLYSRTEQLPDLGPVPIWFALPEPGENTDAAIKTGVFWSVVGGIVSLVRGYAAKLDRPPEVFVTGGDGFALCATVRKELGNLAVHASPFLTLEGIRIAAEALP